MTKERETQSEPAKWIERGIIVTLFLFALFAPHSIAISQSAWLLGMLLWVVRFAFYPPPATHRTPLDYPLLTFFILSGISSMLSYEPLVSVGKLRAASLLTIVYLVSQNTRNLRMARWLAIALVSSCLVNVFYSVTQELLGQGVKVFGVTAESPLSRAMSTPRTTARPLPIQSGDTVYEVDGRRINSAHELATALAAGGTPTAKLRIYRVEWTPAVEVPRGRLLPGTTAESQLGISGWKRGRDWRATGFYDHYVTYAEALQLIASLALGMFLASPLKRSRMGIVLLFVVIALLVALALTLTRASWAGFLISALLMVLLSGSKKTIAVVALGAIPLVIAGALFLQAKRNVSFVDQRDLSTTWRETVWREGFHLLVSKPRHLAFGVGMDSIKGHWREWGLFEGGKIPIGHMHSNFLQIALERGVPALLAWLWLLGTYGWMLWSTFRRIALKKTRVRDCARQNRERERAEVGTQVSSTSELHPPSESSVTNETPNANWQLAIGNRQTTWLDRGIVLGALGGLVGFVASGMVHYNWGDSEVVMIFYFIMGLGLVIERENESN